MLFFCLVFYASCPSHNFSVMSERFPVFLGKIVTSTMQQIKCLPQGNNPVNDCQFWRFISQLSRNPLKFLILTSKFVYYHWICGYINQVRVRIWYSLFQKQEENHPHQQRKNTGQGTKIFQYCTCPAGQVTYNFHLSCKHMHLSFKSVCNKEHKGVICNMTSSSWDEWSFCPLQV